MSIFNQLINIIKNYNNSPGIFTKLGLTGNFYKTPLQEKISSNANCITLDLANNYLEKSKEHIINIGPLIKQVDNSYHYLVQVDQLDIVTKIFKQKYNDTNEYNNILIVHKFGVLTLWLTY